MNICVGNYGAYNAGFLIDEWIKLPLPYEELKEKLDGIQRHAEQLTGIPCEELYISDFDATDVSKYIIEEYSDIYELNLLAYVINDCHTEALKVEETLDIIGGMPYVQYSDTLTLINYIYRADELPYYSYECKSYLEVGSPFRSKEECFGFDLISGREELFKLLDIEGLVDYFNYEDYGRAQSQSYGVVLGDYGYVDNNGNWPNPHYYSLEEVYEDYPDALSVSETPTLSEALTIVQIQEEAPIMSVNNNQPTI